MGKFFGMAIYSGEALSLNLHPIIWKSILENKIEILESLIQNENVELKTIKQTCKK